jgi:hypothetical protein
MGVEVYCPTQAVRQDVSAMEAVPLLSAGPSVILECAIEGKTSS